MIKYVIDALMPSVSTIENDNGIGIDDCVSVSKTAEVIIDDFIDPESYELEVSSPGLDRKLINKEDYDRFIGKTIKIKLKDKLNDRKNFKGLLRRSFKWSS